MNIRDRQNRPSSLALLAAQRRLYSRAKRIRNASMLLVLTVAILGFIASVIDTPEFGQFLPTIVLLSWLFDQQFLATRERGARIEAATIQEAFDCYVLALPWPSYKGVHRPTGDRVKQLATAAPAASTELLQDWYPPDAIPTDLILARLHCQRTNCWWDTNLRRKWMAFIGVLFWGLLIVLFLLSVLTGVTAAKLFALLASNIRVIAWGLKEQSRQAAAIQRVAGLHSFLSSFRTEQPPSAADIRSIQDAIFDHRRSTSPVPDSFYWWHRDSQEEEAAGRSAW